jgi:hypothetical protein
MNRNRQWMVLVRFKDEPQAFVGRQYVTATSAMEKLSVANAICGNLFVENAVFPV